MSTTRLTCIALLDGVTPPPGPHETQHTRVGRRQKTETRGESTFLYKARITVDGIVFDHCFVTELLDVASDVAVLHALGQSREHLLRINW